MSDNEHTAASLRHSEPLAVQYSPADAIPELNKGINDGPEVSSTVGGEEARYILSDNPGGAALSNDPVHLPPERATVSSQAAAESCNAVILAGESARENIDCWPLVSGSIGSLHTASVWFASSVWAISGFPSIHERPLPRHDLSAPADACHLKVRATEVMYVSPLWNIGPMPRQDATANLVVLDEPYRNHPGSFHPE